VIDIPQEPEEEKDYRSYLLRLWRAEGRGMAVWRASLRSAQTGRSVAFANLEELFEYLRADTDPESPHRTA
jgi:hypothetical protein